MIAGFYLAPGVEDLDDEGHGTDTTNAVSIAREFSLSGLQYARWYLGTWW